MNETVKLILEEKKKNRVVFNTIEGLMSADIEEFLKQPAEGILYDLNRDEVTTLSLAETDSKWVNDFAAGFVIAKLKEKLEEIEGKLSEINNENRWIPVEERLPELPNWVIGLDDTGREGHDVYPVTYENGEWLDDTFGLCFHKIIKWKPLPKGEYRNE